MEKTILQSILLILSLPLLQNLLEGLVGRKIPAVPLAHETIARQESPVLYWIMVTINLLLAFILLGVFALLT
jgi:hypothetical protein